MSSDSKEQKKIAATSAKTIELLVKAEKARVAEFTKQKAVREKRERVTQPIQSIVSVPPTAVFSDNDGLINTKIVLLGDASVGKTALVRRISHNIFSDNYKSTMGLEFEKYEKVVSDKIEVSLYFWTMSGSTALARSGLWTTFFQASEVIILMWDPTRPNTFDNLHKYLEFLQYHKLLGKPIVFLRGKSDLRGEDEGYKAQIHKWAHEFGLSTDNYFIREASSKNTAGIEEAKAWLVEKAMSGTKTKAASNEIPTESEIRKSSEILYKSTPFKHSRGVRREKLNNERDDHRWLWLNYMSINDKKSTTCIWLNNLLSEQAENSGLSAAEHDVLRLLQLLDSEETSIWNKLSLFESTKRKNQNVQTQLYDAAKRIYDANKPVPANNNNNNNNVGQIEFIGNLKDLPKEAATIIRKYLQSVRVEAVSLEQ